MALFTVALATMTFGCPIVLACIVAPHPRQRSQRRRKDKTLSAEALAKYRTWTWGANTAEPRFLGTFTISHVASELIVIFSSSADETECEGLFVDDRSVAAVLQRCSLEDASEDREASTRQGPA